MAPELEHKKKKWQSFSPPAGVEDLKAAAANPDSAMDLLLTLGPLAKKVALHKAKGVLTPHLDKAGLSCQALPPSRF